MALLPNIDPQQVLSEICRMGYDTDTVAAICGTVLGARFGVSWIPIRRFLDLEVNFFFFFSSVEQVKLM
jgi:ADP-ribosylglycohydrolase